MSLSKNTLDEEFLPNRSEIKLSLTLCLITGFLGLVGVVFVILHWPYGFQFTWIGLGVLSGYLSGISVFLRMRSKRIGLNLISAIVSIVFMLKYHWPNTIGLYLGIVALSFFVTFLYGRIKLRKEKSIY